MLMFYLGGFVGVIVVLLAVPVIVFATKGGSWNRFKEWLTNGNISPSSSNNSTKEIPVTLSSLMEISQQIQAANTDILIRLSKIEQFLNNIQRQQDSVQQVQKDALQICESIDRRHSLQQNILKELVELTKTLSCNLQQDKKIAIPLDRPVQLHSYKKLFCRQLCEDRNGFCIEDLGEQPRGNCYVIDQYDDTHAYLDIVEDEQVRSQMISGFVNFIVPVCDLEGQSPAGKNSFEVTTVGKLELCGNKWIIKKQMKLKFY